MTEIWSRPVGISDPEVPDYWAYFGVRLVEHAAISPGARVLDVGCGDGSSLFPAAKKAGARGHATGIDICPH
jgi:O-methyltransferase/aklanonic acid methyltransferase